MNKKPWWVWLLQILSTAITFGLLINYIIVVLPLNKPFAWHLGYFAGVAIFVFITTYFENKWR